MNDDVVPVGRGLAEKQLALAMRAGRSGVFDWDAASNTNVWSDELLALYGLTREQFKGGTEAWLACVHPDDRDAAARAIARSFETGEFVCEFRIRRGHTGEVRWMHGRGEVTFDERGHPARMVGINVDITDLKHAEQELQRSAAALREADRRKDEFLAILSHELRNPLAPIRTAATVLENETVTLDQIRWASALIQRQVSNLARLLDDLLDLTRVTQGKLHLRCERVSCASVIEAAVETIRPILDRKQHELRVELPGPGAMLEGDPLRLSQVLSNLLANAAKYTDPGGLISVEAVLGDDTLSIGVTDSGIGIAPDALERLFAMFSQVDADAARAEGGLGIGLALAKGLVELHGGTISAFSTGRGRGSTFTVRLPLAPPAAAEEIETRTTNKRVGARALRILVVDDNADAAESLALLMQLEGHDAQVATSGRAALDLADRASPQAALIDLGMPGVDGCAVARALRAKLGGEVYLIAITGWGQDEDRARTQQAGFDVHFTKPVDPRSIIDAMDMWARQVGAQYRREPALTSS